MYSGSFEDDIYIYIHIYSIYSRMAVGPQLCKTVCGASLQIHQVQRYSRNAYSDDENPACSHITKPWNYDRKICTGSCKISTMSSITFSMSWTPLPWQARTTCIHGARLAIEFEEKELQKESPDGEPGCKETESFRSAYAGPRPGVLPPQGS